VIVLIAILPSAAHAHTEQLQCSQTKLKFGGIPLGQSQTQLVSLTNTGQTSVTISSIGASDAEFSPTGVKLPAELSAGQSVDLNVIFTPKEIGWTSGEITFTSDASNTTLKLSVTGTGVSSESVTPAPSTVSFGDVAVGKSRKHSVVLTNSRTWKVTLRSFKVYGDDFTVSGPTFPVVLDAGHSVTVYITYKPLAAGVTGGSVFFGGPGLSVPVSGTGTSKSTGQLAVSPASLNFGKVSIGANASQPIRLSATGGAVTVSAVTSTNSHFSVSGISFPVTIDAGQSVQFDAVFAPTKSGSASSAMTFTSNASDPQLDESLSGTGVAASYNVLITWRASTSHSVIGYNVYRGTSTSSYSKINDSLDSTTAYTDTPSRSGTYYYVATSVTSAGDESPYSSPVEVSVP
jgi:hypothetical protein